MKIIVPWSNHRSELNWLIAADLQSDIKAWSRVTAIFEMAN